MLSCLALVACLFAAAACGSGAAQASCTRPGAAKALRKLAADLVSLRHAAGLPTKSTLRGNATVSHATDVFLNDVATAPISNLQRNRLIDHAAAALVGSCQQCFQALEAERPIVSIVHGAHKGGCLK